MSGARTPGRARVAAATAHRRRQAGVTLIELVIVAVIVAILAAVAITNYSAYAVRSKRAAAKAVLLQAAQFMERNYTTYGCYSNSGPQCAAPALALPAALTRAPQEGTASYNVAAATTAATYTLTATPIAGVFTDAVCGNFTLDNTGLKGISGTGTIALCWQH